MGDGFPVEFLNGSNPYQIENRGFLLSLIDHILLDNHVAGTYTLKHFVSFTSNSVVAKKYARSFNGGFSTNELQEEQLYDEDKTHAHIGRSLESSVWDTTDHLIIRLNMNGAVNATPGFDELKILTYGNGNKLLLINCEELLTRVLSRLRMYKLDVGGLPDTLELASRDNEWLVLSLDGIENGTSRSALLAHGPLEIIHFRDLCQQDFV